MPVSSWRVLLADDTEIVFERHYEILTSTGRKEPDPDWRFTDDEGHEHYWEGNEHPTLEERWEDYLDDPYDCDPWLAGYFCTDCGEKVHPGWRHTGPQWITIERLRELYREGGVLCATREQMDALMPYVTHATFHHSCALVNIHQTLTPAQAMEIISTIGLHDRSVISKERLTDVLRGMGEGIGKLAGQQPD